MPFLLKAGRYSLAWIMTHCIYCIHPSSMDGHVGGFPLLATWNSAAINMVEQISLQVPAFNSLGSTPINGIAGSRANSISTFLSNCQTVFHSSCAILHAGQQCKVSFYTPLPTLEGFFFGCLFACLFWIAAILMGVRWYK